LTVVVVSYNVAGLLCRCLESAYQAFATAGLPPDVIVVDNASRDGSAQVVRTAFPQAALQANESNCGFGAACNQGLALAGAAALFLNADTELAPDAIATLLRRLETTPRAAVVGPALRYADGRPQPSRRRFPSPAVLLLESTPAQWRLPELPLFRGYLCRDEQDVPGPVDWLSGACLLGRTAALREVGGFDPLFFMYFEEVDLCRRLAARGWQTWYEPAAAVTHHHSQSADQDLAARDRNYYRSKSRYAARYFGPTTARLLSASAAALFGAEAFFQGVRGHRALAQRHASLAKRHLDAALSKCVSA
jgi:GT2 family glycosyltransferase